MSPDEEARRAQHRRADQPHDTDDNEGGVRTYLKVVMGRHPHLREVVEKRRLPLAIAMAVVILLLAIAALFLIPSGDRPAADATAATPSSEAVAPVGSPTPNPTSAQVDPDQAPAPGMDPDLAPPDGPAPDSPPFDVDAYSMRDELRTHGVETPDSMLGALVAVADKYIAQGDPDLDAWDPRIMRDVRAMWPKLSKAATIDVTRCLAEYVERVEARNAGLARPPDEDDHHVTVMGRKEQPRIVTPTR